MKGPLLRPSMGGERTAKSDVANLTRVVRAIERRLDGMDEAESLWIKRIDEQDAEIAALKVAAAKRKGGRPRKKPGPRIEFDETAQRINEAISLASPEAEGADV